MFQDMKEKGKNYTLKVLINGKVIDKVLTHSVRRFLTHLRTINWKNRGVKAYIRVSYGKKVDNYGKLSNFYNDGWYDNKKDLTLMFKAFDEEN